VRTVSTRIHLTVSQNDYRDAILDAAAEESELFWTCPKTAAKGERVYFYVATDGLIAHGTVDSKPEPSEIWNRRYAAQIVEITSLDTFVPLAMIREEMPDFGWARYPRSYVSLSPAESRKIEAVVGAAATIFTDFEVDGGSFVEGAVKVVLANAYERSLAARKAAVRHHGCKCAICSFDFAERYGPAMNDFIHVHHLRPLSEIDESYRVNPKKDLIPVCPNCHAVIHSRRPALAIEEVRAMLRK
jgi:hypothetical protein